MSRRAVFSQTDISRALKGCKAAAFDVGKVEIGRDGKIVIYPGAGFVQSSDDDQDNEWNPVLANAPKT